MADGQVARRGFAYSHVGPGEHGDFPAKWISRDGRTVHLVFSGDDCVTIASRLPIYGRELPPRLSRGKDLSSA
jgi:hypothetical protein